MVVWESAWVGVNKTYLTGYKYIYIYIYICILKLQTGKWEIVLFKVQLMNIIIIIFN